MKSKSKKTNIFNLVVGLLFIGVSIYTFYRGLLSLRPMYFFCAAGAMALGVLMVIDFAKYCASVKDEATKTQSETTPQTNSEAEDKSTQNSAIPSSSAKSGTVDSNYQSRINISPQSGLPEVFDEFAQSVFDEFDTTKTASAKTSAPQPSADTTIPDIDESSLADAPLSDSPDDAKPKRD